MMRTRSEAAKTAKIRAEHVSDSLSRFLPSVGDCVDLCPSPTRDEIKTEPPDILETELLEYQDIEYTEFDLKKEILAISSEYQNIITRKPLLLRYKCENCDFLTNVRRTLLKHTQAKHKKFLCSICDFKTNLEHLYERHVNLHNGFTCNTCSLTFKKKQKLSRHLLIHNPKAIYSCDKCAFSTIHVGNLRQHSETHSDVKRFKCDQCEYSARLKGTLLHHKMRHTGEKNYTCDECAYRTRHPSALRNHKTTHGEHKEFVCEHCGYCSKVKNRLRRHMAIHLGIKPFRCLLCKYGTHDSYSLKCHKLRKHFNDDIEIINAYKRPALAKEATEPQSYACDRCNFRSRRIKTLLEHKEATHAATMETITTEKSVGFSVDVDSTDRANIMYKCDVCNAKYKTWGYLVRHQTCHK